LKKHLPADLISQPKGKVAPVLNQAPHHEYVLEEWRYSSTHSLTSALEVSGQLHGFTLRDRAPGNPWIGGWVGPKTGLDTVSKR